MNVRTLIAAVLTIVAVRVADAAPPPYTQADADAARAAAIAERNAAVAEYNAAVAGGGNQWYLRGALTLLNYANPVGPPPTYTSTPLQVGDSQYAVQNWYMASWSYDQYRSNSAAARRWILAAVRFP